MRERVLAEDGLIPVSRTEELQLILVGLIVKVLIVVGLIQTRLCVCVCVCVCVFERERDLFIFRFL